MSPLFVVILILGYFLMLITISFFTGKDDSDAAFFTGNKQSPWYLVAFGMIGASLSGVTFISVPGWVATSQFGYFQVVLGYLLGYAVIALVLLPIYYRLNLTSIYEYLNRRFGFFSYKTGAFYFLLSRIIGSAFRLYLVALVFQLAIFDKMELNIPFWIPVVITIFLIWVYTFRSGIKTIIYTDTLQTTFLLLAVILTIFTIAQKMDLGAIKLVKTIAESNYSRVWFFDDVNHAQYFFKQFFSGAFITIVMTGLDQDMMQKNLSCKTLPESQKNMFWFSIILVFANMLFLCLGALLYLFAASKNINIPAKADELFPMLALDGHLGLLVSVFFILGLVAAAYSSADSALTALTTSVCVDFLGFERNPNLANKKQIRKWVHIGISAIMVLVIVIFKSINNDSVIAELFTIAGYTYGPLLGLFCFGILHKNAVRDKWVPLVCMAAPVLSVIIKENSEVWFNGYKFGFELLMVNGLLTYFGLWLLAKSKVPK